jgi:hypothetical protein
LSTATDAELQAACSQTSTICLTTTPNCPVPAPADCTATVGELTACANDVAAQTHLLASKVPACSGINRADIGVSPPGFEGATFTGITGTQGPGR